MPRSDARRVRERAFAGFAANVSAPTTDTHHGLNRVQDALVCETQPRRLRIEMEAVSRQGSRLAEIATGKDFPCAGVRREQVYEFVLEQSQRVSQK